MIYMNFIFVLKTIFYYLKIKFLSLHHCAISSNYRQFVPVSGNVMLSYDSLALVCCPQTHHWEKFDGVELSNIQNPAKNEIKQTELEEVLITWHMYG